MVMSVMKHVQINPKPRSAKFKYRKEKGRVTGYSSQFEETMKAAPQRKYVQVICQVVLEDLLEPDNRLTSYLILRESLLRPFLGGLFCR
jgi:hypothetical protein